MTFFSARVRKIPKFYYFKNILFRKIKGFSSRRIRNKIIAAYYGVTPSRGAYLALVHYTPEIRIGRYLATPLTWDSGCASGKICADSLAKPFGRTEQSSAYCQWTILRGSLPTQKGPPPVARCGPFLRSVVADASTLSFASWLTVSRVATSPRMRGLDCSL